MADIVTVWLFLFVGLGLEEWAWFVFACRLGKAVGWLLYLATVTRAVRVHIGSGGDTLEMG